MNQFRNRWPITAVLIGWLAMVLAVAWAGQWLLGQPANASTQSPSGTTGETEVAFLPIILKPPPPPIPSNPNNILFLSERSGPSGTYNLFAMPTSGGLVTQITNVGFPWDGFYVNGPNTIANARWSPDGQQIVYQYNHRLYLVNWDGTGLRTIFDNPEYTVRGIPAWSLDSQQIAIVGYRCTTPDCSGTTNSGSGLFLIDTTTEQMTILVEGTALDTTFGVHWTADQRILAKPMHTTVGMLSIPLNGSLPAPLFEAEAISNIKLSPSRTQMAFVMNSAILYVANVDGTGLTPIFNGFAAGEMINGALWRLDGQQLLIQAYSQTANKLYTADSDGQNLQPRELPQLSQAFYVHSWTADNRLLISTGAGVGQSGLDIYTINLDGSEPINLTADNPNMDYVLDYRP